MLAGEASGHTRPQGSGHEATSPKRMGLLLRQGFSIAFSRHVPQHGFLISPNALVSPPSQLEGRKGKRARREVCGGEGPRKRILGNLGHRIAASGYTFQFQLPLHLGFCLLLIFIHGTLIIFLVKMWDFPGLNPTVVKQPFKMSLFF